MPNIWKQESESLNTISKYTIGTYRNAKSLYNEVYSNVSHCSNKNLFLYIKVKWGN